MPHSSILVLSDNENILTEFIALLDRKPELGTGRTFVFACHPNHESLINKKMSGRTIIALDIKQNFQDAITKYDLIISAHCKQLFPKQLVSQVTCVNIHPGYNPYNRGWYPQVFSILNGQPLGATIHEIDEELDHGKIIDREKVSLRTDDTSLTAYNRVQAAELRLLEKNLPKILEGTYETTNPEDEGNVNFKKDFDDLREIKLEETVTFQQAINRLRALTHPPFKNTYFIDPASGKKIWIEVKLEEEADNGKTS